MSALLGTREGAILMPLKRHFEQRGFDFYAQPPRELVPSFLGSYRPDAIAYDKSGGGVVIEVKTRCSQNSERSLSRIAGLFSDQQDWTFQVIYEHDLPERSQALDPSDDDSIRSALRELEGLVAGGQHRAAFLFAWSVLEAIGRRLERPPSRAIQSPRALIEWLTSDGYLSQASARTIRDLLPLRNALAHGDLMRHVNVADLDALLAQVRGLAATLAATPESSAA